MRIVLTKVLLLFFCIPLYSSAQSIDGLFSDFIKEFKGISLWTASSTSRNIDNELQLRSGFSLRFGNIFYKESNKYDTVKLVKIDTIIDNGKKTVAKHFEVISKKTIDSTFYTSFHLGYETSKNRIIKEDYYTVPSSITGFTLNTITSFKPYERLGLSLILGGGLLSLSSPNSTITDSLRTIIPAEITATNLSAELGIGVSFALRPKKIHLFMDMTYQYIDFENPSIKKTIEESESNKNHFKQYPQSLDFSAVYFKFGISISN